MLAGLGHLGLGTPLAEGHQAGGLGRPLLRRHAPRGRRPPRPHSRPAPLALPPRPAVLRPCPLLSLVPCPRSRPLPLPSFPPHCLQAPPFLLRGLGAGFGFPHTAPLPTPWQASHRRDRPAKLQRTARGVPRERLLPRGERCGVSLRPGRCGFSGMSSAPPQTCSPPCVFRRGSQGCGSGPPAGGGWGAGQGRTGAAPGGACSVPAGCSCWPPLHGSLTPTVPSSSLPTPSLPLPLPLAPAGAALSSACQAAESGACWAACCLLSILRARRFWRSACGVRCARAVCPSLSTRSFRSVGSADLRVAPRHKGKGWRCHLDHRSRGEGGPP